MQIMSALIGCNGGPHRLVHLGITQHGHTAFAAFPVVVLHRKRLAPEVLSRSGQSTLVRILRATGHALAGRRCEGGFFFLVSLHGDQAERVAFWTVGLMSMVSGEAVSES
jgi:hypothetical protein